MHILWESAYICIYNIGVEEERLPGTRRTRPKWPKLATAGSPARASYIYVKDRCNHRSLTCAHT